MSLWVARKYFFSFNKGSTINIISIITVLGIMFSTMAMIFVLSIFNGFEGLITNLYQGYIPDLKIESNDSSSFLTDSIIDLKSNENIIDKLKKYENDIIFSEVLDQEVIVEYEKEENDNLEFPKIFSRIKGVDSNYNMVSNISNYMLLESEKYQFLDIENSHFIRVGLDVANKLNLSVANSYEEAIKHASFLKIWSLNPSEKKPELFFVNGFVNSGIFSISPEFDNYILTSIGLLRNILNKPNRCSFIEIKIKEKAKYNIQESLQLDLGDSFIVKNFKQQMPFLHKMVNTERIAVYLIFILILIVTMITLIGSLTIFILQKKEDMFILMTLGASFKMLKNIFMIWGLIIVFIGLFFGVLFGLIVCLMQKKLNFLKISGNFIIDHYPIDVHFFDVINIIGLVFLIGFFTSLTVSRRKFFYKNLIHD